MKAILFTSFLLLTGCAANSLIGDIFRGQANEDISTGPLYQYRAELKIGIGDKHYQGMTVSTLKGPVDIEITSKFGINRLQVTSCARQDVFREIDKTWFGTVGRIMVYHYEPLGSELDGTCPLYIEAFNKAGLAAWGFVAFRTYQDLPATIMCNGKRQVFAGYSVCQSKEGLEQTLLFDEPIEKFKADELCHISTNDNKSFLMRPSEGICTAEFYSKGHWHTLNMFGYKRVLVSGE